MPGAARTAPAWIAPAAADAASATGLCYTPDPAIGEH
jgi:hypothetical protein